MKEKEQKIEKALFDLLKNHGDIINLELKYHYSSGDEKMNKVEKCNFGIYIKLIEPRTDKELDDWAEKIALAESYVNQVRDEIAHECNHPNFFKRIMHKEIVYNESRKKGFIQNSIFK